MRLSAILVVLLSGVNASGQFPYTRSIDLRLGQQRPRVTSLAEGPLGLLWCGTDLGLVRTDGVRHVLIIRTAADPITCVVADASHVYAATAKGLVMRCSGSLVDTILWDTALARTPVRTMAIGGDGSLWLGTYGDGLRLWRSGNWRALPGEGVLSDRHINALTAVDDNRMVVASDQGLDLLDSTGARIRSVNEASGAPDNLVLSLTTAEDGRVFAGTDQAGVFSFDPRSSAPPIVEDPGWSHAPVMALAAGDGYLWYGTDGDGLFLRSRKHGSYPPPVPMDARVRAIQQMSDGAVFWSDGTDRLQRSDPKVFIVYIHEGYDFTRITALDVDTAGRVWFAIGDRVFNHASAFAEEERLSSTQLELDPRSTIAALHVDEHGAAWVGTMGEGVFRLTPDGVVDHWTEADGLVNDQVLSIRSVEGTVWFATLGGVGKWVGGAGERGSFLPVETPGHRFIYDVLPLDGDHAFAATDGNGILRLGPAGSSIIGQHASYYSLCTDGHGKVWGVGPGTGFCSVGDTDLVCSGAGAPMFEGEVFAAATFEGHLLAMGPNGMAVTRLDTMAFFDPSDEFGLRGINAPLNCLRRAPDHALWLACDRGLVRLRPSERTFSGHVPAVITDLLWGDEPLPISDGMHLDHEQNFLAFGFAAMGSASPEELLLQYQLEGYDRSVHDTRDRQVSYARLAPGHYVFKVRASLPGASASGSWTTLAFTIRAPWWGTPYALVGGIALAALVLILVLRGRDARIRFRERMERDKVRFQLEAVRSQVNPHFLFNSFNTLIELIEDQPSKAVAHTQQLSDFFRNILQVREKDLIALNEELVLLDNYFDLERRRFGDRVRMELDIAEDQLHLRLPPLTLQLLVENAIKHNVSTSSEPLTITIAASDRWLSVSNPLRPRSSPARSTAFGLDSIRQRFAALTDRPMKVSLENGTFSVRIPLIPEEP